MTAEAVAWSLGAGFVLSNAIVIILLGCIDELRSQIHHERARHTALHIVQTVTGTGVEAAEYAEHIAKALAATKGSRP